MKNYTSNNRLLALSAFSLMTALSASAAVMETVISEDDNDDGSGFHDGTTVTATSGDLLETVGTIASSGDGTGRSAHTGHVPASLTIGDIALGNSGSTSSPTSSEALFVGESNGASANDFIEFDLDTTTNTLGYDITSISVFSYWVDQRSLQDWSVEVRTVGVALPISTR